MVMVAFGIVIAGGVAVIKAFESLDNEGPAMNVTGYNRFGW